MNIQIFQNTVEFSKFKEKREFVLSKKMDMHRKKNYHSSIN